MLSHQGSEGIRYLAGRFASGERDYATRFFKTSFDIDGLDL